MKHPFETLLSTIPFFVTKKYVSFNSSMARKCFSGESFDWFDYLPLYKADKPRFWGQMGLNKENHQRFVKNIESSS